MRCRWFGWCAVVGLSAGLLAVSAGKAAAQGGAAESLAVPSLQTLGKVPELDEPLKNFRAGDMPRALAGVQAAAAKNGDLPPAQTILASWLSEVGQSGLVRGMLEQATVDLPDDPEAYVMLAELAVRDRQIAETNLLLTKAQDILAGGKLSAKRTAALKRRVLGGLAVLADPAAIGRVPRSTPLRCWPTTPRTLQPWSNSPGSCST